jgi:Na+:H+ antiporter, NhaA family
MIRLTRLFTEFYNSEKAGGLILVLVTLLSLGLANSSFQNEYISLWHFNLGGHDVVHWINDGIMTIFFLLIGLELEREIYQGELSDLRNASLPIFAAVGGMLLPAGLFLLLNLRTDLMSGAGFLGAIGFTMSVFITLLAFRDIEMLNNSRIAILAASIISGVMGFIWLKKALKVT